MATLITSKQVLAFMNSRTLIQSSDEGKRVQLVVRGNGTDIIVKNKDGEAVQSVIEPGTAFEVRIFNTNSNSSIAMGNDRNKMLLKEGLTAEKAGNKELAHEKFTAFLNAVAVSFNIPVTSSIVSKLADRVHIAGTVVKITTPNGSLLTIDPKSISVLNPEKLSATSFVLPVDETEESTDVVISTPDELATVLGATVAPVVADLTA